MNESVDTPEPTDPRLTYSSPAHDLETTLGVALAPDVATVLAALWDTLGLHPHTNPFLPASCNPSVESPGAPDADLSVSPPASTAPQPAPSSTAGNSTPLPPDLAAILHAPDVIAAQWIRRLPPAILRHSAVRPCSDTVLSVGAGPVAAASPIPSTPPAEPPPATASRSSDPISLPSVHVAFAVEPARDRVAAAAPAFPDPVSASLAIVASGAVPAVAIVQSTASDPMAALSSRLQRLGFRQIVEIRRPSGSTGQPPDTADGARLLLLGRRDAERAALPQESPADDNAIILLAPTTPAADPAAEPTGIDEAVVLRDGLLALTHGDSIRSARVVGPGGLAAAIASIGPSGATLDLAPLVPPDQQASPSPAGMEEVLFGARPNRILCTAAPLDAGKLVAQAKILGLSGIVIGSVGGNALSAKCGTWVWPAPAATTVPSPAVP